MNYLFVMPRYIQKVGEAYMFPLGIAYVSASLRQVRNNVYCLNLNVNMGDLHEEIRNAITKNNIDVIATSGLSPHFNQIKEIISVAKKIRPEIISIVGGGILTATPEIIMKGIPELDIGVIAEGELTIQELAEAFDGNKKISDIKGIIYRKSSCEVVKTPSREDIQDLDSLPFPDYDGFQYDGKNEINICTSRSCPYSCSFCFHTCGKKYRSRSLDNVFSEIDWLIQKYNVKSIGILDELFSINNEKMSEFCTRIEPYHINWSCQMRVDRINVDVLKKMKKAGCISLSFGIESADNRILRSMEKHTTIEQVEIALKMAREAGICPFGNLLLGDKEDTVESFQKCLEWYQSHPDILLGFNKILVLPGSKLYKYAVENAYITDEVKYLEEGNFVINITRMSDEEYKKCVEIMDNAVVNREYPINSMEVIDVDTNKKRMLIKGKCTLCGETISINSNDFLGTQNGSCSKCGKNFTINLYRYFQDELDNVLRRLWHNKKVVLWGMGNEGLKMLHQSQAMDNNVFLVDKDQNKQREIGGKMVFPTEKVDNIKPDIVLIGTNAPVTNAAIKQYVAKNYPLIKEIYNLNKYLFDVIVREKFSK